MTKKTTQIVKSPDVESIQLLPCPFCGGVAEITQHKNTEAFYPRCKTGGRSIFEAHDKGICLGNQGWWAFPTREEAIKAWNARAK